MTTKINGSTYVKLLDNGIRNLNKHKDVLNDLNVFPVPDGDTGTNMVMTLRYAYESLDDTSASLQEIAKAFSTAAVFGARGNSGVIVSQFFKGISEVLKEYDEVDSSILSAALDSGCKFAYASVAKPVEGTILTVIKDGSDAVRRALPVDSIDEVINVFLTRARISLENTPKLLPILKKAGVVDSGASGIVYFFEGVSKFLAGEDIEYESTDSPSEHIDLTKFNKDTVFSYGYCTEGLIQLKMDISDFDYEQFGEDLTKIGNSIVTSLEGDKLKLHIHTKNLGRLMAYCQTYGEFLTVKIENMTVQNMQKSAKYAEEHETKKYLYDKEREPSAFAVIAVATNEIMQKLLFDMGADVVILSEIAPSSQEFMEAFDLTDSDEILVFPNSPNSILASMQAASMHKGARVSVLNSRSLAECYSSLAVMDFGDSVISVLGSINDTLSNLYEISIYHATKDVKYGRRKINRNEFFSLCGKELLEVRETLEEATIKSVKSALEKDEYNLLTIFYGKDISDEYIEYLREKIEQIADGVEVVSIPSYETLYSLTLSFE